MNEKGTQGFSELVLRKKDKIAFLLFHGDKKAPFTSYLFLVLRKQKRTAPGVMRKRMLMFT